jgi:hypothetical protein
VPRTASNDVTDIYLHHYGHLDVYGGTHSLQDVKQPMLEWMNQLLKLRLQKQTIEYRRGQQWPCLFKQLIL